MESGAGVQVHEMPTDVSRTREDRIKSAGKEAASSREYRAEHPVVRTHPETGRKALYVNVAHTVGIRGLTDDESGPLLRFLFAHQVNPNSPAASSGSRTRWRFGTTAARSMIRSTTITAFGA
jgi:alpha-ketoglutarate-dependent taurine dioxygenase